MKLQINTSGSWRDVVDFPPESLRSVQSTTEALARVVGKYTWRIAQQVSGKSPAVVGYLEAPSFKWRRP